MSQKDWSKAPAEVYKPESTGTRHESYAEFLEGQCKKLILENAKLKEDMKRLTLKLEFAGIRTK